MTGPYKVHVDDIAFEGDLTEDEGWIDMKVQFLINRERGGATRFVIGRTVFPPGAAHSWHRHHSAEEYVYVESGRGVVLSEGREVPVGPGDIAFHEINEWHGFRNDSDGEVVLLWGWGGAASTEEAGYEADPEYGRQEAT